MGSGKGSPEYWVAVVKPGRVMFEIGGVPEDTAREALRLAANKLPIKCKFVTKEETEAEFVMKASEIREMTAAELNSKARRPEGGAFQPAFPARYQSA